MKVGDLNRDVFVPWPLYWAAPWIAVAGGGVIVAFGPAFVGGVFMAAGAVMVFNRLTGRL